MSLVFVILFSLSYVRLCMSEDSLGANNDGLE